MKQQYLWFLYLFFLTSCLMVEPLKLEKDYIPKDLNDDWEISTPEAEGVNPALLDEAYGLFFSEEDGFRTAISLIVIRNGKIIAEGYCRNTDDHARLNNIKSATKSVTSVLYGMAIKDGFIDADLSKDLSDYLFAYTSIYPDKSTISIFNILTMQSGIQYDNDVHTGELLINKPASSLDYILSKPMAFAQGTRFDYHDGNTHLIGAIIQAATNQSLADYAKENLFEPLNIQAFEWEKHPDGLNYGAFGLYLKPRDFAKFGQLILNEGIWNNRELVDRTWLQKSVQPYANMNDAPYGLQWWIRPAFQAFSSAGHGGQYTYVLPEKELLIVYTAEPTVIDHEYGTDFKDIERIVNLIVEAVE